jgi:hypothetical protein
MNKRNTKYWIIRAIAVIIGIGLTFPFLLAKSRLNAEIAKLQKEGLPVTPQEFANKYYKAIPDEENAAGTFDEAYDLYQEEEEEDSDRLIIVGFAKYPKFDQKIAPVLLSTAQEFIKGNSDLLNKMNEIRRYNRIHFDYDWEKGYGVPLPRLNKIRNTARIYAIKAELIINQNDHRKASELLKEMFHFNKLASQNPFMIGQLVFYACDGIVINSLERYMNTLTFSPKQLKEFEKICTEHEQYIIKGWSYMWKTELTFLLTAPNIKGLKHIGISPYNSYPYIKNIPKKYRQSFYYYSGGYINDLISQVKSTKAIMNVPVDIYVKRKRKLEKIEDDNKWGQMPWFPSGFNTKSYLNTLKIIARLRCAKTACAVERFRLKYAKLPENLNQLVPEFLVKVPIDPFDGKNLRYFRGEFDIDFEVPLPLKEKKKKESEGGMFGPDPEKIKYKTVTLNKKVFYVYSVGKDLIDDKGGVLAVGYNNKDITFIVIDKNRKLNE